MPLAGAPSPRSRMCVVIIFFWCGGAPPPPPTTSRLSALGAGQQPFAAWGASHLVPLGARRWSAALCCLGRVPPRASRRSALVSIPLLLGGSSHLAPLGARRWSAALCCLGARPTSRLSALGAGQQPFAAWGRVPPRASQRSALVRSPLLLGAHPITSRAAGA